MTLLLVAAAQPGRDPNVRAMHRCVSSSGAVAFEASCPQSLADVASTLENMGCGEAVPEGGPAMATAAAAATVVAAASAVPMNLWMCASARVMASHGGSTSREGASPQRRSVLLDVCVCIEPRLAAGCAALRSSCCC